MYTPPVFSKSVLFHNNSSGIYLEILESTVLRNKLKMPQELCSSDNEHASQ